MKTIKQFVFTDSRPFKECHASTLIVLPNGNVLASWFGGTKEKNPDVAIWLSRREDIGEWCAPIKVADEEELAHWNPVLFQDPASGRIYLYYKVGHEIPDWYTRVIHSDDGGYTWSTPVELIPGDIGGRGPVRSKPIILSDGRWIAPASIETRTAWDAFVDFSDDQGRTWIKSSMVPLDRSRIKGKGIIQPTLWEGQDGIVHMLLRSTEGAVYRSDSNDRGLTWSEAYSTSLPNNNSGIDLVKSQGTLYLVMNPIEGNWAARTPLVIQHSIDGGQTWKLLKVLEDEPGEYSYPAIVTDHQSLHLTYTWRRERIVYWNIEL
ncbi:sialidase family protein [Paenibacillus sp. UNC451MF]|uniref:sialidase family protein n=1 Tax=Paenibacillus sp. UNC451MF TaxID=1449063 RepID=UPI000491A805|nr:sialidase family protein [Paenibacillus sp. UNC451MF]